MDKKPFPELGLAPELLKAMEALGFELPSPIQAAAIPPALEGRDVVGQSQTGSGKTMAFAIPVVQRLEAKMPKVQALILCPTRELAMQVCSEVHKLAAHKSGIKAAPIYGGASYQRQIRALEEGAQIVVGTPGRVLDLVNRGTLRLKDVRFLVFDEADEMLDMGFRDEIDVLMEKVPADRQTLFFSATMAGPIRDLVNRYTKDPAMVTIEHKALTVPTVQQMYFEVHSRSKLEVLCRVLDIEAPRLAIIFANTKRTVDDVTDALLARGYAADRLHGDLSQALRERVMRNFRNGSVEVLIATDVAARGLDVDDVDLVVNFEPPYDEEDYVHRIGRTGRAGRSGKAVCLVSGREIFLLQRIMRYAKVKIERRHVPSREELEGLRADSFFEKLKERLESGEFRSHEDTLQRLLDAGHTSTDVASALMDLWLAESAKEREEIMEDRPKPTLKSKEPRAPRETGEAREAAPEDRPRKGQKHRGPNWDEIADDLAEGGDEEAGEKPRRRPPAGGSGTFTRLFINLGAMDSVGPGDIAGAIYRLAQLPQGSLGKIEIFEKSSFVGVPPEHVDAVIQAVSDTKWRGRPLRMDVAERQEFGDSRPPRRGGPGGFGDRGPRRTGGFRSGPPRDRDFGSGDQGGDFPPRRKKTFGRAFDKRPPFEFPGKGGRGSRPPKPFKKKR